MAYILKDSAMIAETKVWIEAAIQSRQPVSYTHLTLIVRLAVNHSMLNDKLRLNVSVNSNTQNYTTTGDGSSFNRGVDVYKRQGLERRTNDFCYCGDKFCETVGR